VLVVPTKIRDAILAHALAEDPRECCGVLAGTKEGDVTRVAIAIPIRNASPSPEFEYVMDGPEQLAAFLRIEDELSLDVVGVYHSHPRGPAGPSATDAARANLPGASYLVVWLRPETDFGSFVWTNGEFRREEVPASMI
jgi:desampylase